MMLPMTGDPGGGRARAIEHGEKCQDRPGDRMKPQGAMSQSAVIADGGSDSANPAQRQGGKKDPPARPGKQDQSGSGGQVDENGPGQHHHVLPGGAPPWPFPSPRR